MMRTFIACWGAEPASTRSGVRILVSVKSATCAAIDNTSATAKRR
jgi:hypothetical protein